MNLQGKRILITGVSAGLGIETARALAAHGAQVIGAARDLAKAEGATAEVRKAAAASVPQGAATSVWAAVVASADEIGARYIARTVTSARSCRMTASSRRSAKACVATRLIPSRQKHSGKRAKSWSAKNSKIPLCHPERSRRISSVVSHPRRPN